MTHVKYSLDWGSRSILFSMIGPKTPILLRFDKIPEPDIFSIAKYADGGTGRLLKTKMTNGSFVEEIPITFFDDRQSLRKLFEKRFVAMIDAGCTMEDLDANSRIPY